ncbi:MAG: hypothetical protein ACWA41_10850 [Putridiphycobacter sp.]
MFLGVIIFSCKFKSNNETNINSSVVENSGQKKEFIIEPKHAIDETYLSQFKQGKFNLIINRWETKDKDNNDFDSVEFKDFRMAIYYLSLLEETHNADMNVLLDNYDSTCYEWTDLFGGNYVYYDCFFDQVGFYMLQAFIVYDFENFHSYGLCHQDLHMNRFYRIKGDERLELFNSFESDFIGIRSNDTAYFDSLKTIYPYWSYIDTVKKYNQYAKEN